MADLVEGAGRRATDPLGRRFGGRQLGIRGLERDELAEELVVFGVADLRRVLAVVELVGPIDLRGEGRDGARRGLDVELRRGLDERGIDRRERRWSWMRGYRTSRYPALPTRVRRPRTPK